MVQGKGSLVLGVEIGCGSALKLPLEGRCGGVGLKSCLLSADPADRINKEGLFVWTNRTQLEVPVWEEPYSLSSWVGWSA